jgi:hypothetical protein
MLDALTDDGARAIAQAVSHRLPTAATLVRVQVSLCGIAGRQSGTGVWFLRVLRLPLPLIIHHLGLVQYSRLLVADVPSELSHCTPRKLKN